MTCVSTGRAIRCWTADVWFAHSRDRGACWRQTHVAGPVGLRPAEPSVPIFVGEYQRLAALRAAVSPVCRVQLDRRAGLDRAAGSELRWEVKERPRPG